jgi:glycosyltransferase involved in cell wall biosynthesis
MTQESDRPLPYHIAYVAEACQILQWVTEFRADRIHAHFGTNSAEVAMLAHVLGGPAYSFTIHGPTEFLKPIGIREKIRRSSFVVAISCFCRSQIYMLARHEDWPKIKIVRCGLEESFYAFPSYMVASTHRLVCVGRLCKEKGQLLLIEAVARLASKGIYIELVLAGDGPMRSAIEASINEYALGTRIKITGWISSNAVRDEILAARALVLPTFAEGLPVVIMEAMALHRPVLTTYIAGIPELVIPGETGWLFPAGSIEDLTSAIEDCLSKSTVELQKMGDAGHNRVLVRHSSDLEAGKLAQLFLTDQPLREADKTPVTDVV